MLKNSRFDVFLILKLDTFLRAGLCLERTKCSFNNINLFVLKCPCTL